ncbi:unnamed protein product [marine sediment metagenome]|uniref:Uncharacterized protein n=1 Tax=marine sediment metagenome TaxID=412755 RepID=X1FA65_9ZZZZ
MSNVLERATSSGQKELALENSRRLKFVLVNEQIAYLTLIYGS